ncbi:2-Hydroxyacid oxidase 1-like [Haemaphysalis longicornis]
MSSSGRQVPRSIENFERLALAKLAPEFATYISRGTDSNCTVRENQVAFDRWRFLPKVLSGASDPATEVSLLGKMVSMPVGIAPTAAHKVAHPEAELAACRAAQKARIVMAVSARSSTPLEEVAAAAGPDAVLWAQLDIRKDRSITLQHAQRAKRCGCTAIVLTVDHPFISGTAARSAENESQQIVFNEILSALRGSTPGHQWDPNQSWADVDLLRNATDLPVIVKGILRADDAVQAVNHGASAIIVSNHGGRYMDGVSPTLDTLPAVVRAVGGRCDVYMDGGVRSGDDVVKALCLGAKAVFVGRPALYGLAYNGEEGVTAVLECIRKELCTCLSLMGCHDVQKLHRGFLVRSSGISVEERS